MTPEIEKIIKELEGIMNPDPSGGCYVDEYDFDVVEKHLPALIAALRRKCVWIGSDGLFITSCGFASSGKHYKYCPICGGEIEADQKAREK